MKTALITGITGQDGAYLAKLLLEQGYKVYGALRRNTGIQHWRTDFLGITDDIEYIDFDLGEFSNIKRVVEKLSPDEIYNLAAQSFVQLSFEQPIYTNDVNFVGVSRLLECLRGEGIKFYQAGTSEMFGKVQAVPQSETTDFYPRSPYGVSKLAAFWMTKNYREAFGMFNCNGILFNHESPLRGEEFVTRKVIKGLAEVSLGKRDYIELGNLDAKRDWGHAEDYVRGMWLMMQNDLADDYVLATGETYSIEAFVVKVCSKLNLVREDVIKLNELFIRPSEVDLLVGDSSKARTNLGWTPKYDLDSLIDEMIECELKRMSDQIV